MQLSEKLAYLMQQHEQLIKKPIPARHLSKLTGIYVQYVSPITKALVNRKPSKPIS